MPVCSVILIFIIYFVLVNTSYATTNTINNNTAIRNNNTKMETTHNYYDKDKINSSISFKSSEISSEYELFDESVTSKNNVSSRYISSSTASRNKTSSTVSKSSSIASNTQTVSLGSSSNSGTSSGSANNSETVSKALTIQSESPTTSSKADKIPNAETTEPSSINAPVNAVSSDNSHAVIEENTNLKGTRIVNINTAAAEELATYLPGVGEVTAALIIEYRNENGAFNSVDEIINVKGIGEKKLEQLRPFVSIN